MRVSIYSVGGRGCINVPVVCFIYGVSGGELCIYSVRMLQVRKHIGCCWGLSIAFHWVRQGWLLYLHNLYECTLGRFARVSLYVSGRGDVV